MVGINTGLYIGYSGLQAARGGLLVTGNNVANVNTEGYTRQMPTLAPGITLYEGGRVLFGSGATIQSVNAMRDQLVEREVTQKKSTFSFQREMTSLLKSAESMIQDQDNAGLGPALSQFFQSLQNVSAQPDQVAYRISLLDAGSHLASTIRNQYQALTEYNQGINQQVGQTVTQVNNLSDRIAALNRQIGATPGQAAGLVDERNALVNQLAELVDIDVYDLGNNLIQVNATNLNVLLVGRETANPLSTQLNPLNQNYFDVLVNYGTTTTNITASIGGGKLGALLQARDQENPTLLRELDNLAAGLIDQVNAIHTTGFAQDGVTTGLNYFEPFPTGAPGPNNHQGAAANIRLSVDVDGLPQNLALSATGAIGDNGIALALAQLRRNTAVIDNDGDGIAETGTFESFHGQRNATLGAKIQSTQSAYNSQKTLLDQALNRRDEVSAVSLDEEALNLSQYQKAFEANSRFMRVIDQLMEQIIANLG
ncbi:MAG: flagellar hook-associated protein FlgK [Acidobacteria bacterium]|nr:flagellar hook-associated protein FlgK [Acidobacteriota bacterium]MCB9396231.1 flagellar hook-associated protein FlgK [Acidobacteriota bacterium]